MKDILNRLWGNTDAEIEVCCPESPEFSRVLFLEWGRINYVYMLHLLSGNLLSYCLPIVGYHRSRY